MTGLGLVGMRREVVCTERPHLAINSSIRSRAMQMNPYLTFKGQCEAAFKFYEKVLGGKIVAMMPHEGTPAADHVPAEWRSKIMHARLVLDDDRVLMGSDAPPGMQEEMKGFSVTLGVDKPAEAERIFHALAEDGTVRMPIQETFWATRFGMLTDRFGTPWMINCEKAAA
jgi:PhnB protein